MLNSGFAKDNINAKINTKINKWLTFDFNARLSYQKVKGTEAVQTTINRVQPLL